MHSTLERTASIARVSRLGDDELVLAMQRLLREEREISAQLLVHLGEVDRRQLYRQHALSSMFEYCVQALHLSEAEAYLRIGAARLGRRFPRVLIMLAAGELHLSALKLLAPMLDEANRDELLAAARFKSKCEVELLLARRREQPDVPSIVRKIPAAACAKPASVSLQTDLLASPAATMTVQSAAPREQAPFAPAQLRPMARPTISPHGAERYKVQLTANRQLHDKLRQAQDLMRHELPSGDIAQVLERALDLLIADRMKRRFAQTVNTTAPGLSSLDFCARRARAEARGRRNTLCISRSRNAPGGLVPCRKAETKDLGQ